MKKFFLFLFAVIGALVVLIVVGGVIISTMSSTRPLAKPVGSPIAYPWGAMHVDEDQDESDSDLEKTILDSFKSEPKGEFDPDEDGDRDYAILVLSGGGSAGAFGAGLLSGWSKSGTRPDFKVVTGVSTGSLQATFAYLGPDYDDELTEVFTKYGTDDIYTKRNILGALLGDSTWDSQPLKELIDSFVDENVLEAVAAKHATGHRLFVGTSNMDTSEFIIWDMGAIASSKRKDKLERYRNVLLASSSIPILFPPVYFDVEIGGKKYYQMHVDGSAQSQVFMRGFMLDFEETLGDAGLVAETSISIYVIRNGIAREEATRHIVEASSLAIASAMIKVGFDLSAESSLFRIYVLATHYGIDFNFAAIPDEMFPELDPLVFNLDVMRRVYDYAHDQAQKGYGWAKQPPRLHPDERSEAGNNGKSHAIDANSKKYD